MLSAHEVVYVFFLYLNIKRFRKQWQNVLQHENNGKTDQDVYVWMSFSLKCAQIWPLPRHVTWFSKNFTSSECQIYFRKIRWISSSSCKPFWGYEQFFNGEVPPVEIGLKLQNLSNNGPIDWGKYVRPQNQNLSLKFTLHRAYLDYVFVFRVY